MKDDRITVDFPSDETSNVIAKARRLTREYYLTDYEDKEKRRSILSELFGKMGTNIEIDTPFYCNYGKNILLGNNVIININCTFIDDSEIIIGNNVLIASNVQLYTASHTPEPYERIVDDWEKNGKTWFRTYSEPITIEDGVWLGGGVIVLPGVVIGKNSVVGAGSVVNRSIPANCVAVGNPCRPIRFFN